MALYLQSGHRGMNAGAPLTFSIFLLFFFLDLFLSFPICVFVSVARVCRCPQRPEDGVIFLELELWAAMSYPSWVLENELEFWCS